MTTTLERDERVALEAAMRERQVRVRALGRALADGEDLSTAGLTPDEVKVAHEEASKVRRLRVALEARKALPGLREVEARLRAEADARRTELLAEIQRLTSEVQVLGRPVVDATRATQQADRDAREAVALLRDEERARVVALEQRAQRARARASSLRRQADEAPGLVARWSAKLAEAVGLRSQARRGHDDAAWLMGLEQNERQAREQKAAAEALSPSALRREAEAADADADEADRELADLWSEVEVRVAPPTPKRRRAS